MSRGTIARSSTPCLTVLLDVRLLLHLHLEHGRDIHDVLPRPRSLVSRNTHLSKQHRAYCAAIFLKSMNGRGRKSTDREGGSHFRATRRLSRAAVGPLEEELQLGATHRRKGGGKGRKTAIRRFDSGGLSNAEMRRVRTISFFLSRLRLTLIGI